MNFGQALEQLKQGKRVARSGWNGKGMWLALTPESSIYPEDARSGAVLAKAKLDPDTSLIVIRAHIDMCTVDGSIQVGWLASQTDMLADDWSVVE